MNDFYRLKSIGDFPGVCGVINDKRDLVVWSSFLCCAGDLKEHLRKGCFNGVLSIKSPCNWKGIPHFLIIAD